MADQPAAPPGMAPSGVGKPAEKTPAPKKGLFGGGSKAKETKGLSVTDVAQELNSVSRRLLMLEERYQGLRKKTQVTDGNILNSNKKMMMEIKTTVSDVNDLRRDLNEMKDNFKIMIQEIKDCAKKDEVRVLHKYIDMWNPMNFVTRDEVDRLIERQVVGKMEDLNLRLQEEDYIKEQIQLALSDLKKSPK